MEDFEKPNTANQQLVKGILGHSSQDSFAGHALRKSPAHPRAPKHSRLGRGERAPKHFTPWVGRASPRAVITPARQLLTGRRILDHSRKRSSELLLATFSRNVSVAQCSLLFHCHKDRSRGRY